MMEDRKYMMQEIADNQLSWGLDEADLDALWERLFGMPTEDIVEWYNKLQWENPSND